MKKELFKNFGRNRILQIALVSGLAIFAASCSKEDNSPVTEGDSINPAENIIEVLDSYGDPEFSEFSEFSDGDDSKRGGRKPATFRTLSVALARAGLAGTVARNQLTIFAPTDEAFAALGLTPRNIASVPNLAEILLYHVFPGKVFSGQLSNGFFETVGGSYAQIDLVGGVKINDANILKTDIKARNGVIHIIDKVMFPPDKNLVELALSFNPEFSILVQAVIKAGLTDVLATGGPYTVFAPTNAAFVDLLGFLGATSLDDIPVDLLTKVLLYHVVEGRVFSSDLSSGPVPTLNGTFNLTLEQLRITDANGRNANLIPSLLNVQATNGVVHVIDKVILPDLSK
jgi:uncharacterized surface protein with fasciclin (FAS1) repeats